MNKLAWARLREGAFSRRLCNPPFPLPPSRQ